MMIILVVVMFMEPIYTGNVDMMSLKLIVCNTALFIMLLTVVVVWSLTGYEGFLQYGDNNQILPKI